MAKKGSWIVRVRCEVVKEVVCDGCTEEEARSDPYGNASDEYEVECLETEVLSVKPNE